VPLRKPDYLHRRPLLRARRERPRGCRAAEQRYERAAFQLVELHSMPASQLQHIELGRVSQELSGRNYNLSAVGGGRPPGADMVHTRAVRWSGSPSAYAVSPRQ
jgi:hypothetical protein